MLNIKYKAETATVTPNVLNKEQCADLIANSTDYQTDFLRRDIGTLDPSWDRATILKHTLRGDAKSSVKGRMVELCGQEHGSETFTEWDGYPVYRSKVMRYSEGAFVGRHRDSQWACLSNFWVPNTNKSSKCVITIALNDDYEGGEFVVDGKIIPQKIGQAIQIISDPFSPQTSPVHEVTKVTKGTRYSLVFWNFA